MTSDKMKSSEQYSEHFHLSFYFGETLGLSKSPEGRKVRLCKEPRSVAGGKVWSHKF